MYSIHEKEKGARQTWNKLVTKILERKMMTSDDMKRVKKKVEETGTIQKLQI